MKCKSMLISVSIAISLSVFASGVAISASPDKYTVKVPGGLAFSEFKGYESWQVIAVSHNGDLLAAILGNPKMAKVHWNAKKATAEPGQPTVPGTQHDVDFMLKDSKRFADSGGWGYGEFEYDAASDTFKAGTVNDMPPQANDAKCGYACHTVVQKRDYVFTEYGAR
jgi:hypothetical protein